MSNPLRRSDSPLRRSGPTVKREPGRAAQSRLAMSLGSSSVLQSSKPSIKSENGVFKEYPLRSCTPDDVKDVRHHVLKFHSKNVVKPKEQFTEPVRFHRKDPRNLQFQLTLSEQQERRANREEERQRLEQEQKEKEKEKEKEKDKKPQADMSVVAPDGGARKQAQPFQKKTRQIHSVNEEDRKLRYEEYYPWVMEDFDGQNTWVGNYEAAQSDCFALFVFDKDGFKMVPAEKWYKMTPRNKYATLTLEEAEQKMEKNSEPSRWIMRHITKEQEEKSTNQRRKFKAVQRGPETRENEDELDFDEEFADDEEAPIMDGADDEVKEVEDKIKREQRTANTIGVKNEAEIEDEETKKKIDKEGKRLRKYLRSLEKNANYSSDDEDANPYATEEEDSDDDLFEEVKKESGVGSNNNSPSKKRIKQEGGDEADAFTSGALNMLSSRREKKVYTNLPPGVAILQLPSHLLGQFQKGIWNPNAKRPREDDIRPATTSKKIKTERGKSSSPPPPGGAQAPHAAQSDASSAGDSSALLTEEDVRPIIQSQKLTIKQLLRELNAKLRQHPDNQKRLKMFIGRLAKLHEGYLVLKDES